MFQQIDWLFFDVGSTLIDERIAYEHRFQDIAMQASVSMQSVQETAHAFYLKNLRGDLEAAKFFGVSLPKWHTEDEHPYPNAASTLAELHKRYQIGIIANQSLGTQERLRQFGLHHLIDLIIASAEEGVSKPDPRIFQIAAQKSRCPFERSIMIGDRIDNDIVPAKKLGMHTIWIKQGNGRFWRFTQENEVPDAIISSLSELCDLL